MSLPPGVSRRSFSQALQEFESAVGKDWVFARDDDVALYNDAYSPFAAEPAAQLVACAAVAPASVEQVQQIVRTANKYKIPLFATSTGRNLGYGGSAPTYAGSVVVDLKRMNRVLEVNEQDGFVVVEPGVSFIELYRHFEERGLPFMVATPEPGWGSPIGNALEHGVSMIAGDNFAMARGLEVVLPTGELLRTGAGALPTSRLWQHFPYGFGPHIDGMFSQSNFGIVTKMGFSLIRRPEMQTSFSVSSSRSEDLYPLVETIQRMRKEGLLYLSDAGSPIRSPMPTPDPLPHLAKARDLLSRRDGGSHAEWDALGRSAGIAVSLVTGNVRGPAKIAEATIEHARDLFARIPGVNFQRGATFRFPLSVEKIAPDLWPDFGVPSLWPFSLLAPAGTSRGLYFFSPVIRASADDLFGINQTIREVVLEHADEPLRDRFLRWYYANTVFPNAFIITYPILVTDDAAENLKQRQLFERLVAACAKKGWGEYRTHAAFQSHVMSQYSFNEHALLRFHEALKDAIDPNGVLAPGKAGIWPQRLRTRR